MDGVRGRKASTCLLADVLPAALAAVAFLVGSPKAAQDEVPPHRPIDALAYTFLALAAAGMPLRRHAPLTMLAIESIIFSGYLAAGYPHGPIFFGLVAASFAVGSRREPKISVPMVGAATAAAVLGVTLSYTFGYLADAWDYVGALLVVTVAGAVPALIGTLLRNWRRSAAQAEEEVTRRRIEQERLRMAREVHDVVGHSLSIISLQAAVALHVLDRRPQQAQVALEAIRRTSVDALDELRATLALTRAGGERAAGGERTVPSPGANAVADSGGRAGADRLDYRQADQEQGNVEQDAVPAARTPLTGLSRLPGLLAEIRLCGVPVDLYTRGPLDTLPAEVDLTAYRVVQESLTNVLRHAGRSRVQVALCLDAGEITIDITDEPRSDPATPTGSALGGSAPGEPEQPAEPRHPGPPAEPAVPRGRRPGHGLAGLRERAAELGGRLEAGPRPGSGWRVWAVLPARGTGPPSTPMAEATPR
jgi:signal transduction histidine kinase